MKKLNDRMWGVTDCSISSNAHPGQRAVLPASTALGWQGRVHRKNTVHATWLFGLLYVSTGRLRADISSKKPGCLILSLRKHFSPLLTVELIPLFSGRCLAFVYGGFYVKALRPFRSSGAPELKKME